MHCSKNRALFAENRLDCGCSSYPADDTPTNVRSASFFPMALPYNRYILPTNWREMALGEAPGNNEEVLENCGFTE